MFFLFMLYEARYRNYFPTVWPWMGSFTVGTIVWLFIFCMGALYHAQDEAQKETAGQETTDEQAGSDEAAEQPKE
jgi:hypothetical protein